jgi:hypothetical protein
MPTAQQWRVYIDAKSTAYCAVNEIEFRTVNGVSRSFSGGTLTWNNEAFGSSYDGQKAIDGNDGTHWIADVANPWIAYDYGAGNECDIVEVYLKCSFSTSWVPLAFSVQYWDGSAWVSRFKWDNVYDWAGANNTRVFRQPGLYELWRLYILAGVDSTFMQIAEIQFRDEIGVSQLFSGGQVYGHQSSSAPLENAIDNNHATNWSPVTPPVVIAYDFGNANSIEVVQFSVTAAAGQYAPKTFALEYYDPDSVSWVEAASYTNETGWSDGETRLYGGMEPPTPLYSARPVVFVCT